MEGTASANASAKTNANADPSPLKGVRDDSCDAFFRGLLSRDCAGGSLARIPAWRSLRSGNVSANYVYRGPWQEKPCLARGAHCFPRCRAVGLRPATLDFRMPHV